MGFKGQIPWNKGKNQIATKGEKNPAKRLDVRKKISEARKGKPHPHKSVPCSEDKKRRISESNKGKKISEEQRKRISQTLKGRIPYWSIGKRPWNYKKPFLKMEKNPNWRGGITPLRNKIRNCFKYRQWRCDIFTRDDFTCYKCGVRGGQLEADHYPKSFEKIFKENKIETLEQALACEEFWNINNGRTSCKKCHPRRRIDQIK